MPRDQWEVLPPARREYADEMEDYFRASFANQKPSMAARLGNVLYWLGCLIAGLCGLVALWASWYTVHVDHHSLDDWILPFALMFGVPALAFWLIGRALRYILAGR